MATLRAQPGATVQVLGWDEAFIGITTDDPEAFARAVQSAVLERTELHCSVGIGDTLVRAKVATGFGKPRGVFRLTADNWLEVMGARPTIDLWGVGTKISQRLEGLGIRTVAELAAADEAPMVAEFGPRMGLWYAQLGRGEASSVVDDTPWVARGHGRETTFQQNLVDRAARSSRPRASCSPRCSRTSRPRAGPSSVSGSRCGTRRSSRRPSPRRSPSTFDRDVVLAKTMELVEKIEPERPIRLLGVRAEMAMPDDAREGHSPTRSGW